MIRSRVEFDELDETVVVTLKTRCPEKYMLIDRENGNIFIAKDTGEWELIRDRNLG